MSTLLDSFVFTLTSTAETWTVVGPTVEDSPHTTSSLLQGGAFLDQLVRFRDMASRRVTMWTALGRATQVEMESLARAIAVQLTPALLSEAARGTLVTRLRAAAPHCLRLTIRVPAAAEEGDAILALPWELLLPDPGLDFPVRSGFIELVREVMIDATPPPPVVTGPLVVAVSIAAPEDQGRLGYEEEARRLQAALEPLGHDVAFANLGEVDDLVRVVGASGASAIHFSGHGEPGRLVFEDELGFAAKVPIDELVSRLRARLGEGRLPSLFYVASCHGAGDPAERSPSTAAALHRAGVADVIGYFGPISDALSTRVEETFYTALAAGKTTYEALAAARESTLHDVPFGDDEVSLPFAWTQIAFYHRGPDRAPARLGEASSADRRPSPPREVVMVSGTPLLKHGFIGRRSMLHRIRRRLRDGQRLLVIQGLGGLGKTALASHMLATVLAPDMADQLVLACGGLDPKTMDVASALWQQVDDHAERWVAGWEKTSRALREAQPEPISGFERSVELLRRARPSVVLYADNMEALQEGPADASAVVGAWSAAGWLVWEALERLSAGGLVMVTTRYAWAGLAEEAWVRLDPMSDADIAHMVCTWPTLAKLPRRAQMCIAQSVERRPRTVELLDRLIEDRLREMGPAGETLSVSQALALGGWNKCGSNTYPAGAFPACQSVFGVFDLHGNAAEHMNLPTSTAELGKNGGSGVTEMKGSWFVFSKIQAHQDDCRWRAPSWHESRVDNPNSHRNYHLGFRCCKDVE